MLAYVREKFPATPVILISGLGDHEQAQSLIKLGAFDFLVKPFTLEVVEGSVRKAVAYREQLRETSGG